MAVYYNEWDPYAAQWLRNLIKAGHLPEGDVDERDIRTISAADLRGYSQCHFFAGIGGWPLALKLAGWGERPIWTGSCPCQPFSSAGSQKGQQDERHLWPDYYRLIKECRPAKIFGEQVKRAITYGWLDDALHDLENIDYACAAVTLTACAVQGNNEGERIYFVAQADSVGSSLSVQAQQPSIPCQAGTYTRSELSRILATEDWPSYEAKSGIRMLDDGLPNRVGTIKAYGNAIDPELAAKFIQAAM